MEGFSGVVPIYWKCAGSYLDLVIVNKLSSTIGNLELENGRCEKTDLGSGKYTQCKRTSGVMCSPDVFDYFFEIYLQHTKR